MSNLERDLGEPMELTVRPRATEAVSLQIPQDTLESLRKVARQKDMSVEALLKFYIGKCLRQDLTQMFADQVLDSTAKVLTRHNHSEAEVAQILQEIRAENS
jgi:hypothetical protein